MKNLFFIALCIPPPLSDGITSLKRDLAEKYGARHALKTPPHITLQMPIRIDEENINDLFYAVGKIQYPMGSIRLMGFSSFPPRTIFIEIQKDKWLEGLHAEVRKRLNTLSFVKNESEYHDFHPHITLMTRDLRRSMYRKAIREMGKTGMEAEADIDTIQLLKHDGKLWQVVSEVLLRERK